MTGLRQRLEELTLLFLGSLLRNLPRRLSLRCGAALGSLVYRLGIRREVTQDNLRRAYPQWEISRVKQTALNCYRHFGTVLAEFARLPRLHRENMTDFMDIQGREVLDRALSLGKGAIVVSGHMGNWELMGASIALQGYPVSYIVTTQQNERVELLMDRLRRSVGVQIIKRRQATRSVLQALRENRIVAILVDQDAHEGGAFVPFFGRLASTPRGAAIFALRTSARLVFAESYRQGLGRLKVIFTEIQQQNLPEDKGAAVLELTRRFTARLEEAVRRHPEQWFWMHRRWKTPPPP